MMKGISIIARNTMRHFTVEMRNIFDNVMESISLRVDEIGRGPLGSSGTASGSGRVTTESRCLLNSPEDGHSTPSLAQTEWVKQDIKGRIKGTVRLVALNNIP